MPKTKARFIENGMRLKHGANVKFTIRSGREILESRVIPVDLLGGALTLAGYLYNGLTVSGGVDWRHPGTGRGLQRPTWTAVLVNPDDELTGDQTCDCPQCVDE